MENKVLTASLKRPAERGYKIMTHLVAGYPSFKSNLALIKVMAAAGVDLIEIQIPFSEPIADGSTITRANQVALERGATLEKVFHFMEQATKAVSIPILVMTYYNIPFRLGLDNFFRKCQGMGVCGIIIPDIPFDDEKENYFQAIKNYPLSPIIVISPNTKEDRLNKISKVAAGFIYTTLKIGTTGSKKKLSDEGLRYLKKLKKSFPIPLAAGFGLSDKEQVKTVSAHSDIIVIGSHIMELLDQKKLAGVKDFLLEIT